MKLAILLVWAGTASASSFLLTYTFAPGTGLATLTPEQMAVMRSHGERVMELQRAGVMQAAGHTTNPDNTTGIAIVTAADEAAARAIADADPAVRAGLVKVAIQPFAPAFPPPAATLVKDSKTTYDQIARFVLDAARKMPEKQYGFQPASGVRTFGQIVAHIAEAQYLFCGAARGDAYAAHDFEKTRTAKEALVGTLETAFAYCQEAFAKTNDATAADRVPLFGQQRTRLGVLDMGAAHTFEHYGNLVTYMRLQGLVPPSSE